MEKLVSKLQWLNNSKQAIVFGFCDYTFKDFKKNKVLDNDGISMFLLMAVLLGDEENESFQSELYDFIVNYESDGYNMLEKINEHKLTAKSFKEMMLIFLLKYEQELLNNYEFV